jgi:hypothetical protein
LTDLILLEDENAKLGYLRTYYGSLKPPMPNWGGWGWEVCKGAMDDGYKG